MPSRSENTAIQVIEIISGGLSVIACISMSRKIWLERSMHVTNSMLLSLFGIDLVLGVMYALGQAGTYNDGICQLQAFLLQWFEVAAMLWTILMSYLMYQWIARRKHPKRMEKTIRRFQIFLFTASFVLALILLATGTYGNAYLFCWVTPDYGWVRVFFFEAILLLAWVINMIMLQLVFASIKNRFRRTSVHARLGNLLDSTAAIQRKLVSYVAAFLFLWMFALINRFVEYARGEPYFPTALLQVIFLPLQGFVNALCYGDYIDVKKVLQVVDISSFFHLIHDEKDLREVMIEPTPENLTRTDLIKTFSPKKYSIFTTTLNVGEASLQSIVGDLKDWIVEGHDVYAIGLQECIDLNGLREAIFNHLGGPSKYQMYTASIGSGNTRLGYHGFIALTVFVKLSEIQAGNIHATATTSKTMATGTDLIITTAQNKGAVGIPLQIHDTSIGFVTCHLPSDSKGKSKLVKRNASAHAILKEVILAPEDLGFDLHLQHDHILVFGDLNYRMETDGVGGGVNSLTGVAVACTLEKQVLNDDPLWLSRKYNLLRHFSDPLHPSIEEVKLIHQAKSYARGAWKSVLRADELRSIMDDGDAFFGFEEPMPCFPPSYKRRKGKAEGGCGDYSDFKAIIRGYSHTGYVENILERPSLSMNLTDSPTASSKKSPRPVSTIFRQNSAKDLSSSQPPAASPSLEKAKTLSAATLKQHQLEHPTTTPISIDKATIPDEGEGDFRESESIRESDSERFSEDEEATPEERRIEAALKAKRKRRALINKEDVAAIQKEPENAVHETDPSKLRPPSYTDRILIHSLPDRSNRLTVKAYDFCDTLRVSDHRAVSMTILLEVNQNVIYNGAAEDDHMTVDVEKEPKFALYELIISELSVTILDLKIDEEEEEALLANASSNDGPDATTGISNSNSNSHNSSSNSNKQETNFQEMNPMFGKKSFDLNSPKPSISTTSTAQSPLHHHAPTPSTDSNDNSPKRKKKGGVKFSHGDDEGPNHHQSMDVEMASMENKGIRFDSNTTENSHTSSHNSDTPLAPQFESHHHTISEDHNRASSPSRPQSSNMSMISESTHEPAEKGQSMTNPNRKRSLWTPFVGTSTVEENSHNTTSDIETGVVPRAGRKANRKKSIFAVLFSKNTDETEEVEEKNAVVIEDEDTILKDMARESLDWKNTLHQPGEWRKKVLEEQRREKEKQANTSVAALKKKHKSDEKMIHQVTVVFPLPAKDPLLVYRRIYDYSQAFDIDDKSQKAFGKHELKDGSKISKEELLKAMTLFQWHPKPTITYASEKSPLQRNQLKFESDHAFRLKGCAAYELGAHALLKFNNRLGYEFGSSVVCLSHLIHRDPNAIHSSYMKDIPLSAGGQKRGHIAGKFSLKYIRSALSEDLSPI